MRQVFTSKLKARLRKRETLFAGWLSFANPSISEIFSLAGFDFLVIDMEHSTINQEQAQRIISSSQSAGVPCLPRPVSHSIDHLKPLLESGGDGAMFPLVESARAAGALVQSFYYPPEGKRSYGVSRAQSYGLTSDAYFLNWNREGVLIVQIENIQGVEQIEQILKYEGIDGVMIGPMDLSGSLGVPGEVEHPDVLEASNRVIEACERFSISCGTQLSDPTPESVERLFARGFTYAILASDLFVLTNWSQYMKQLMNNVRGGKKESAR